MEIIDLSVVVCESNPLGRYYLAYLYSIGVKPRSIIVLKRKSTVGLTRVKSAISRVRNTLCEARDIAECAQVVSCIENSMPVKVDPEKCYSFFSNAVHVVKVGPGEINDDNVYGAICDSPQTLFLFAGGGLVQPRLLSIPGKKFIHTHPGIVPDIKGADCFFWSLLLRNRPGYSCFYMSEEIDEGEILFHKEFEIGGFSVEGWEKFSVANVYRGILDSLDLHLRAQCLSGWVLENIDRLQSSLDFTTVPQNQEAGRMYFYMSPEVRALAVEKIIRMSEAVPSGGGENR